MENQVLGATIRVYLGKWIQGMPSYLDMESVLTIQW